MSRTPTRAATTFGAAALSLLALGGCADRPTAPNLRPSLDKEIAPELEAPPSQYVVLYKDGVDGLADPASASGVKLGDLQYENGSVFAHVDDPEALRDDPNVESVT